MMYSVAFTLILILFGGLMAEKDTYKYILLYTELFGGEINKRLLNAPLNETVSIE